MDKQFKRQIDAADKTRIETLAVDLINISLELWLHGIEHNMQPKGWSPLVIATYLHSPCLREVVIRRRGGYEQTAIYQYRNEL